MQIQYIQDPGHGWIAVNLDQQKVLGISEADMTPYSYTDRYGTIFAEEDCDAAHVFNAAKARGIDLDIQYVDVNRLSEIGNMRRCGE